MQGNYNGYKYHTFYAKIYFSHKRARKSKKKKLALTSFYGLGQEAIGWFIKTSLRNFRITPGAQSALQGTSAFINKIEATI